MDQSHPELDMDVVFRALGNRIRSIRLDRGWKQEDMQAKYVLPWTQFLYAEGTSEEVRGFFSTHDVVVKGSG
ncbi:MAG: hypothetical protein WKF37_24920 [Bryobacteraceae bacterium]